MSSMAKDMLTSEALQFLTYHCICIQNMQKLLIGPIGIYTNTVYRVLTHPLQTLRPKKSQTATIQL